MVKPKARKSATNLVWRTPLQERITIYTPHSKANDRRCERNCTIANAQVLGFCTIYDKKVKGGITDDGCRGTKTIQKVEFDGYDTPNVDTYICVSCEDFMGRGMCFVVQQDVDKYLLAMPRNGGETIVIISDEKLFTVGPNPLHTNMISVEDMDFLKFTITEWYDRVIAPN